jgi:SET domain-containing protein
MSPPPPGGPQAQCARIICQASDIHGTGVFAKATISKGERVVEYVGERIDKQESLRRCELHNEHIFGLDATTDLDGSVLWNSARYLNHSCSPNSEAILEDGRVWIVATQDITAGQEITFNYGFDLDDYRSYPCHCGAPNCVGYIVAEDFFDHVLTQAAAKTA